MTNAVVLGGTIAFATLWTNLGIQIYLDTGSPEVAIIVTFVDAILVAIGVKAGASLA